MHIRSLQPTKLLFFFFFSFNLVALSFRILVIADLVVFC